METNDLSIKIENLYTLVRLHKWCEQLTHGISDIVPILSKGIHHKAFLKIRKKIESDSATKEEIVLSLVLLRKTGAPISQICDITYSVLINRLRFEDTGFLLHVFFNDIYPLPPDLIYDITNRVFLSFRRAIKSALKIDSLISYHNPETVILYLTLLLCRVDLNEENKAIIYFLLSRIDFDLSPALAKGVTKYLRSIKSIIEKVVSSTDEPLENEYFRDSETQPLPQATTTSRVSTTAKKKGQIDGNKKILPADSRQNRIKPLIEQIRKKLPKKLQREELPAAGSEGGNRPQEAVKKTKRAATKATTPAGKSESKPLLYRSTLTSGKYIKAVLKKISSQLKYSADKLISTKADKPKPYRQPPADQTGAIQESGISLSPQFEITFSRNTPELLSILNGLYKKKDQLPSEKLTGEGKVSPIFNYKSKFKPLIIALVVCAIFVPLYIAFSSRSGTNSSQATDFIPAAGAGQKQSPDILDQTTAAGKGESAPVEGTPFSSDGKFYFKKSDSALHWVVTEKTSFWHLHRYLRVSPDLPCAELEYLGNLDWELYLDKLTELNPGRDLYTIIYPGETFLLWSP